MDAHNVTFLTIDMMCEHVRKARVAYPFPTLAHSLLLASNASPNPNQELASQIFHTTRRFIVFRRDEQTALQLGYPEDTEVLQSPLLFAKRIKQYGDCDDFSMFAASLLRATNVGIVKFAICKVDNQQHYSHVYVVWYPNHMQRIVLDCSHAPYMGWEANQSFNVTEVKEIVCQ